MLLFLLSICDPKYHPQINMLVETYQNDLLVYAKHILKTARRTDYTNDAMEVLQNTYMKISLYPASINFNVEPKQMRAYLKKILRNEAMMFISEFAYLESLDDETVEAIDEARFVDILNAKEDYIEVKKAIKKLKEIYSFALSHKFCEEMKIEDIAKLLGVSTKTIYTRIERGKKLLIDMLIKGGKVDVDYYK